MQVTYLHPQGLPDTERYRVSLIQIRTWKAGWGNNVEYAHPRGPTRTLSQIDDVLKRLKGDQAVIVEAEEHSGFDYAGVTVFGSRRAEKYLRREAPDLVQHLVLKAARYESKRKALSCSDSIRRYIDSRVL